MGKERLSKPYHPTQKPVKILKHIIKIASNEGDLVFDPFMGVGSSGVAAIELGRRFLGIEIDAEFCKASKKRLDSIPLSLTKFASDTPIKTFSITPISSDESY
jgi:site-specific DNA-methyltransferase (adenine-specific)/modification methylase